MEGTAIMRRHMPLITQRIIFAHQALPGLPTITPRIDFDMEDLTRSRASQEPGDKSDDERDELLSALSSIESDDSGGKDGDKSGGKDGSKIPKPAGEAGRPRSGGYNLKEVLGWTKADFDKIQVRRIS
jgi:hypothetical protein